MRPQESTPLLPGASPVFEYRNRPYRDVGWLIAYLVLLVGSLAGGVVAFLHRNTKFADQVRKEHLADPASCPLPQPGRHLLQDRGEEPFQIDDFLQAAGVWIGASAAASLLIGVLFLYLVKGHARALVFTAIAVQLLIPAGAAGAAFSQGATGPGCSMLLLAGLLLLVFVLWREQIELVTRLLGVAGHGLAANPGLVPTALLLQLLMGLLMVPLVLAGLAALMNGHVAYNGARAPGDVDRCVDVSGEKVSCCVWQVDGWVPLYLVPLTLSCLWTVFLAFEIKVFTVGGAIAQWYFAPTGGADASGSSADGPAKPSAASLRGSRTLRSLRHGLGPSLGSLCLGSAVLTWVALARAALDKLREDANNNIFLYCLYSIISFLYDIVEFATKFTSVRMAITGEGFWAAGHSIVDLLRRNFLDAFGVWWLPPMILQSCALVVALGWGALVYAAGSFMWAGHKQVSDSSLVLALVAVGCAWAVLSFFCALLVNIIDAVFVCYAMDRDMQAVHQPEVHLVYARLPSVHAGQVVENPDGAYMYAAPQQQEGGQARGAGYV